MPVVFNLYKLPNKKVPDGAVYIGRGSKWGNPFTHMNLSKTNASFKVSSREKAIEMYKEYILHSPELLSSLHELRGKDLVCFCKPATCHGDILVELANAPENPDTQT